MTRRALVAMAKLILINHSKCSKLVILDFKATAAIPHRYVAPTC